QAPPDCARRVQLFSPLPHSASAAPCPVWCFLPAIRVKQTHSLGSWRRSWHLGVRHRRRHQTARLSATRVTFALPPGFARRRQMKLRRTLLVLAAAGALAFALSGCFVIVSDTPSQENVIGDVIVHTVTCTSSVTSTDSCPDEGNSGEAFNDNGPHDG